MSRRKNEVLSTPLTNTEEFQAFIDPTGKVNLIDCYPKWTGPCKAAVSHLKRLKLEMGSDRLRFGTACIEDCEQLNPYLNTKPEPLFLYFASGVLVARIRGLHGPKINDITMEVIQKEDKIEAGELQRVEISHDEVEEKETASKAVDSLQSLSSGFGAEGSASGTNLAKQVTFSIITPQYIEQSEEILDELRSSGVEVLCSQQMKLSEDDVRAIIPDLDSREGSDAFIEYITGSACCCLVLTRVGEIGHGVVSQMNLLVGPSDQGVAQREAPDSINSLFGNMTMWTSPNTEAAQAAVAHVFPNYQAPAQTGRRPGSASNTDFTNKYLVKTGGDIRLFTEELERTLQNSGCSVVSRSEADGVVVVSTTKSLASFRDFFGDHNLEVTDQGVDGYLE